MNNLLISLIVLIIWTSIVRILLWIKLRKTVLEYRDKNGIKTDIPFRVKVKDVKNHLIDIEDQGQKKKYKKYLIRFRSVNIFLIILLVAFVLIPIICSLLTL